MPSYPDSLLHRLIWTSPLSLRDSRTRGVRLFAPEATSLAGHLEKVDGMLPSLPESTHKKKRAVDNNFQVGIHRSHRLNMAPPRNKARHRRKAERREREPRVQLRQKLPDAETRDLLYDAGMHSQRLARRVGKACPDQPPHRTEALLALLFAGDDRMGGIATCADAANHYPAITRRRTDHRRASVRISSR